LKKKLRKKLLEIRKKKYLEIKTKNFSKILDFIKKNYSNVKIVGGYAAINYEYDCLNLLKFLESKNYMVSLPVIKNNFQMNFYKHSFQDPLKLNKLGIPEPFSAKKKIIPDLIFVPLVGFDTDLNRLGYGGGFYDRYFDKNLKLKKIIKIGLAFSFQKIKKIPINKFDIKLDRIITEKKI
tara:strand:- start:3193 stop:3732 length:540 start_codon:yes stop_codon:yes gene_type:complete